MQEYFLSMLSQRIETQTPSRPSAPVFMRLCKILQNLAKVFSSSLFILFPHRTKHKAAFLLGCVALETFFRWISERPLGFAIAAKFFKSPASCLCKTFAVFLHYVNEPTFALAYITVFFLCFQKICDNHCAISKYACSIPFQCFGICINIVQASKPLKTSTLRSYQRRLHVHPFAVTVWIWHGFWCGHLC